MTRHNPVRMHLAGTLFAALLCVGQAGWAATQERPDADMRAAPRDGVDSTVLLLCVWGDYI